MTGEQPFSHCARTPEVLIYAARGGRPLRPPGPNAEEIVKRGLDDSLWQLLTECWAHDPAFRPTIQEVLERL